MEQGYQSLDFSNMEETNKAAAVTLSGLQGVLDELQSAQRQLGEQWSDGISVEARNEVERQANAVSKLIDEVWQKMLVARTNHLQDARDTELANARKFSNIEF